MIIPGILISAATFPGVVIHELAHLVSCRMTKTPVFKVCYFQMENPCGYVIHEEPKKLSAHVWITIAPFIFNTLLGALIATPAAISNFMFDEFLPFNVLLLWLGISIAMHAFPSTGDARSLMDRLKSKDTSIISKILLYPVVGIIHLGALGSVAWLDLLYGMGVAMALPMLAIYALI